MTKYQQANGTGIEVYFFKYRKFITILSIVLLLYFPFDIYLSPAFIPGHTYQTIGHWLNDIIIYVAVPIGLLVYLRRLKKAHAAEAGR